MGEGSSYIPYSALEYNDSDAISGISGSAIAGGVDSAVVSSIVSSYVESSVSGKADQSALEDCCSAMSSVVSAKADSSALSSYVPYSSLKNGPTTATISAIDSSAVYDYSAHARISTLSTSRIPYSAIEYAAGTQNITGISGSAIIGGNVPTTELVVNPAQMSAAVSAGNIVIGLKTDVYTPVLVIQNSADATASNVIYVVTGNA